MAALARRDDGAVLRLLAFVHDFCPRLLAEPFPETVEEARGLLEGLVNLLAMSAGKAISPFLRIEGRRDIVETGRKILGTTLTLLDTLIRVPLVLLDAGDFGGSESTIKTLHSAVHSTVALGVTLDRAAAELGLSPWEGPRRPFADLTPPPPQLGRKPRALPAEAR